jgi:hypothetical protein
MNKPLGSFGDQLFELGRDAGRKFARDVVKGVPKAAGKQILGDQIIDNSSGTKDRKIDDRKKGGQDPVTGKPVPSKKTLTQLTQATVQLQQIRLKKVREELEKQRLKVSSDQGAGNNQPGTGPEIPVEKPKVPQDNAVQATLRNAQSTGEAGKNIGG